MPLGIDPKVDFAFKLMLGSPEHPAVTIHFLNAILEWEAQVVACKTRNPGNLFPPYLEFAGADSSKPPRRFRYSPRVHAVYNSL